MSTKLGVHIQDSISIPDQKEFFRVAQPPVAKLMADEPDLIRECKEVSPNTFWVGRVYVEHQSVDDPLYAAEKLCDSILRRAICRDVDAWEGHNEPSQWNHIQQAEFECHMAELLAAEELDYVAFSWSVGNPRLAIWHDSIVLEALRLAAYLGLHEYCAPSIWDIRGFDPPYTDREAYLMNGWFTLRYRKAWETISQYLEPVERPQIIITEFGIDSGACHWDPHAQGGWKSFFGRDELPQLFEQIDWYDHQLLQDPYVIGATWFTFGTRDWVNWGTFDFFQPPEARAALAEHLASKIDPVDLFDFIAGYLNDPDVMIPANPEAALQQYAWRHGLGSARTREEGYGGELVHQGNRYLAQLFMRDEDLSVQHIVFADLDDPRPWTEKTSHFDRTN